MCDNEVLYKVAVHPKECAAVLRCLSVFFLCILHSKSAVEGNAILISNIDNARSLVNAVPAPAFQLRCFAKRGHRKRLIPRIFIFSTDRLFSCQSAKQKADTQRHLKSAGALFSLQNDVLCIGFGAGLFIRSPSE